MGSDNFLKEQEKVACIELPDKVNYITKFKLYETHSNFYMIGWNKSKTVWRVLKIDRSETSELIVIEDSVRYSEIECQDLLRRIDAGNMSTGGLKFVTICYGIIGFIRFLGPHYMLLITKRTKIGMICGHAVFSISKSRMIPIPNSTKNYNNSYSKNENRYKKLLQTVDLTKDFFFSYSYHVMHSLQKNLSSNKSGLGFYETMFVWNEYLTRGIRNQLKNSLWTVALVHGFFKQAKLTVSGREFFLTLIARRSRHYAGTRYLKRGVNEKGRVANEVETEQIVFEDFHEGRPVHISSVVQIRGSIPLFWSQETSRYFLKPDIILSRKDHNYEATKLHFQNLVNRYGNPIIILNLIKAREKKPRESILHAEFVNAIEFINKDLSEENHLKFLHWDLNRYSRVATSALQSLVNVASSALRLTGIFCCQVLPTSRTEKSLNSEGFINCSNDVTEKDDDTMAPVNQYLTQLYKSTCSRSKDLAEKDVDIQRPLDEFLNDTNNCTYTNGDCHINIPTFQKGVLRTNCIDCLDRTNVAQYAYGLVALGHQLYALGFINAAFISLDFPLAGNLMKIYEEMGDTLALQYGGSPAHNKIFSEKRGQWKAATHSQEFIRLFQRYCSNAYMDGDKQDAINIFLGHFQPQPGKPALWELDSDQHYKVGSLDSKSANENSRSAIKRSFSDGSILCETSSNFEDESRRHKQDSSHASLDEVESGLLELSDSRRELSTCDREISYSRYTPSNPGQLVFQTMKPDSESDGLSPSGQGETFDCSNFVNVDWISSSSCEEDFYERSALLRSSYCELTCFGSGNELKAGTSSMRSGSPLSLMGKGSAADVHLGSEENAKLSGFSETFVKWVTHGDMLFT